MSLGSGLVLLKNFQRKEILIANIKERIIDETDNDKYVTANVQKFSRLLAGLKTCARTSNNFATCHEPLGTKRIGILP